MPYKESSSSAFQGFVLALLFIFSLFPPASFGSDFDNIDLDKLNKSTKREIIYNIAAVDIFQELRKNMGERLRVSGGLISCGYEKKAEQIKPTTFELMAEAFRIMETLDLNSNGHIELTDKRRLSLARRVVTASTIYMMSGGDPIDLVSDSIPDFRSKYCNVLLNSFERIYSELPTDGYCI
jgi:hypothetical protein